MADPKLVKYHVHAGLSLSRLLPIHPFSPYPYLVLLGLSSNPGDGYSMEMGCPFLYVAPAARSILDVASTLGRIFVGVRIAAKFPSRP